MCTSYCSLSSLFSSPSSPPSFSCPPPPFLVPLLLFSSPSSFSRPPLLLPPLLLPPSSFLLQFFFPLTLLSSPILCPLFCSFFPSLPIPPSSSSLFVSSLLSRYITRLLEDVVFFVINKENPGAQRPDPLVEEGIVDRDRQKLIREQDVLKEVGVASLICHDTNYTHSSPG